MKRAASIRRFEIQQLLTKSNILGCHIFLIYYTLLVNRLQFLGIRVQLQPTSVQSLTVAPLLSKNSAVLFFFLETSYHNVSLVAGAALVSLTCGA